MGIANFYLLINIIMEKYRRLSYSSGDDFILKLEMIGKNINMRSEKYFHLFLSIIFWCI
jgi:hypothetical protein